MTSVDDVFAEYEDEPDEATGADDAGGTTPRSLSLPDEAPRIELVEQIASQVAKEIDRERRFYAELQSKENLSGYVQFSRYSVPAQPIQICREKKERGDTVITNFDPANGVSIGLHAGILYQGGDTAFIAAGASRTVKTRQALWAIAGIGTSVVVDVQEEYF